MKTLGDRGDVNMLGKTLESVPKSQLRRKQHKPCFEEKLSIFVEEKKQDKLICL